jgi:hypothetical protein
VGSCPTSASWQPRTGICWKVLREPEHAAKLYFASALRCVGAETADGDGATFAAATTILNPLSGLLRLAQLPIRLDIVTKG